MQSDGGLAVSDSYMLNTLVTAGMLCYSWYAGDSMSVTELGAFLCAAYHMSHSYVGDYRSSGCRLYIARAGILGLVRSVLLVVWWH